MYGDRPSFGHGTAQSIGTPLIRDELLRRAFVDFDDPEPLEEFDDDDIEDDEDDRNALTDDFESK